MIFLGNFMIQFSMESFDFILQFNDSILIFIMMIFRLKNCFLVYAQTWRTHQVINVKKMLSLKCKSRFLFCTRKIKQIYGGSLLNRNRLLTI